MILQGFIDSVQNYFSYYPQTFEAFITFVKSDNLSRVLIGMAFLSLVILIILPKKTCKASNDFHHKDDMHTLAGDDVVATQLDLAKAYIEMDKKVLAKQMLKDVAKQGNRSQKKEAKQLIKAL